MSLNNFTFLTFNTFGIPLLSPKLEERYKLICKRIELMDIDLVNFQEVHTYLSLKILKNSLLGLPYLIYEPGLIGPKGGLVTFSRFPINKVSYWRYEVLLDNSFIKTISNLIKKRGVLIGKLSNKIIVINTHLTNYHEGDSHSKQLCLIHLKEIYQLSKAINKLKDENAIIISGDFNLARSGRLYQEFVNTSGAEDVFARKQLATYHQEYLPPKRKANCIDYIFVRDRKDRLKIKRRELVLTNKEILADGLASHLSDHLGLCVEFQI